MNSEDKSRFQDELYNTAVMFVSGLNRFAYATLQRHFMIGYNRACHLIEAMVENGDAVEVRDDKNYRVYWLHKSKTEQQ